MIDVTIIGSGRLAAACARVLDRAGFNLRRGFEIENDDRSPVILGEINGAYNLARQVVESGRHLLIANPAALTPERLSLLLENRKRSQALFVWSERRQHPGYHLIAGLIESDSTWRPRFLRQETLTAEPTTSGLARWYALEALGLVMSIAGEDASRVEAQNATNVSRNAPDLLSFVVSFPHLKAYVQVGLGEPLERRETLLAAADRKAFIDELNPNTPLRLIEDERSHARGGSARWLSCPSPSPDELARQQCLSFLDATLAPQLAVDEARLWLRALATLSAAEQSISSGASINISVPDALPRFRLIPTLRTNPPTVA